MHVFFSVGEPSGDEHAAELIREMSSRCPDLVTSGFGGPQMAQAGQNQLFDLTELAMMGIGQIVPHLRKFFRLAAEAKELFETEKPDAVVLVDYPGFNWHIAKRAKKAGIPVFYYMPPQLWAWAPWRIRKVHKWVDTVLSGLPFEAEWYRKHGVDVVQVSHPFFDHVAHQKLDDEFIEQTRSEGRLLGILPGSRKQEVEKNFPVQVEVARRLHAKYPDLRFPVACYKEKQREFCQRVLNEQPDQLPITLEQGKTSEIIEASDALLMVSGSVSLEVLARRTPAVVLYRGSRLMWALGYTLITVPYFTLTNLIAGKEIAPEHPFVNAIEKFTQRMTAHLDRWFSDESEIQSIVEELDAIANTVAQPGGTAQTAEVILSRLGYGEREREEQPAAA